MSSMGMPGAIHLGAPMGWPGSEREVGKLDEAHLLIYFIQHTSKRTNNEVVNINITDF